MQNCIGISGYKRRGWFLDSHTSYLILALPEPLKAVTLQYMSWSGKRFERFQSFDMSVKTPQKFPMVKQGSYLSCSRGENEMYRTRLHCEIVGYIEDLELGMASWGLGSAGYHRWELVQGFGNWLRSRQDRYRFGTYADVSDSVMCDAKGLTL